MYKNYDFTLNITDNSQYTVICEKTGFVSDSYTFSDQTAGGSVDGIEDFRIVQTDNGTALEVYQYVWASVHANRIGDAVSVFIWKNSGFALISQRFEK